MRKAAAPFGSEAEMCAAFIAAIGDREWVAYPETAGWDILLVRKEDGAQIGIEAKLRFGLDVINQAIEDRWGFYRKEGPDFRAVLVPHGAGGGGWSSVCAYVGITVIQIKRHELPRGVWAQSYDPYLPDLAGRLEAPAGETWYDLCVEKRCVLPAYVPDVACGVPAPVRLTTWKIKAIKIAIILEQRGVVTRADFRALAIDHRRWLAQRWLLPSAAGWCRGAMPDFKAQHPRVYEQIAAEAEKWMPARGLL